MRESLVIDSTGLALYTPLATKCNQAQGAFLRSQVYEHVETRVQSWFHYVSLT